MKIKKIMVIIPFMLISIRSLAQTYQCTVTAVMETNVNSDILCNNQFNMSYELANSETKNNVWHEDLAVLSKFWGWFGDRQATVTFTTTFEISNPLKSVTFNGIRKWSALNPLLGIRYCDGYNNTQTTLINQSQACYEKTFTNIIPNYHSTVTVSIIPKGLITLIPSESSQILPSHHPVTIHISNNYPQSNGVWQYQFISDTEVPNVSNWIDFPSLLKSQYELTFSGIDLSANFINTVVLPKKKVAIRRKLSCVNSEIIILSARKSSPEILNAEGIINSCYNFNDGAIKLTFSSQLLPNETINLSVVDITSKNNITSRDNISVFNNENGKFTYTINDVPYGRHRIEMIGKYPDASTATYSDGSKHTVTVDVPNRSPVAFSDVKSFPVNCHGGSDGRITVQGSGGTGSYYAVYKKDGADNDTTPSFGAEGYTIGSLSPDNYTLRLYDSNGCQVKNGQEEKTETISISQPAYPLTVAVERIFQPRGWGLTDGWIKVRAQGGTMPYTFTWTDGNAGDIAE
ncbi:MAG: SprB repeat-containing protein, partial [Tannerella sp.]|nr:SprB repeat-containing protein [Tannerella sp.]